MNPLQRILVQMRLLWYRIVSLAIWRKIIVAGLIYLFFFSLVQLHFSPVREVLNFARYYLCEYQMSFDIRQLGKLDWLQKPTTWLPEYTPFLETELESPLAPATGNVRQGTMLMPVEGEITSGFGWRLHPVLEEERFHYGIDIAAPEGTIIRAAEGGLVSRVEEHPELGLVVYLDHGNGVETLYAHCSAVLVEANQPVQAGENIATVGATGLAVNPHLHFEIKERGVNVDPALWLGLLEEGGS